MLSGLSPKEVFYYFEEISKIPHGSGNTEAIAQYLLEFAEKHQLRAHRDRAGNVMIFADATEGFETREPVILQGHMDMVCAQSPDSTLDMEKDGIEVMTDGEHVWANGTTLGGDDGIAAAYILAILASKEIVHPPIEALLTVDEETDMSGANGVETQYLQGRRLINIDSEDEGILTVSCAGGVSVQCAFPMTFVEMEETMTAFQICVSDLLGGHSGAEIHKPRQNAVLLLVKMLRAIKNECDFLIVNFQGGAKENAIPKEATVILCVEESKAGLFEELAISCAEQFTLELEETEPELSMEIAELLPFQYSLDAESTEKILSFLEEVPNGVASMSQNIQGLVQTSSNLGIAWMENERFYTSFLVRSSVTEEKESLKGYIKQCATKYMGVTRFDGDYPAWEYEAESPLREKMMEVYEDMYGKKPAVEAVHAGLECGVFAEKMPGIDMVSFGPNLTGVHTPDERMDVASVRRCWEYLLRLLQNL